MEERCQDKPQSNKGKFGSFKTSHFKELPTELLEDEGLLAKVEPDENPLQTALEQDDAVLELAAQQVNGDSLKEFENTPVDVVRRRSCDTSTADIIISGGICLNNFSGWKSWMKSDEMRGHQLADSFCQGVIQGLKKGGDYQPTDVESSSGICWIWRSNRRQELVLSEGVLYKKMASQFGDKTCCRLLLIIPNILQEEILKDLHTVPTGGHLSLRKTKVRCAARFWWPGWKKDIWGYCEECQHTLTGGL